MMKKILIVGCGHMGSALLSSWYKKPNLKISVVDPNTHKILKRKYLNKISIYKSLKQIKNIEVFNIIVFAVKPQMIDKVINNFNLMNSKSTLYLSIVAGKNINYFENKINHHSQIIRAMPNMPAFVGKGMTCLLANKNTSKKNKLIANQLFQTVGKVIWLYKEPDMDLVTAISGSGPGYYFLFIEHLISESKKMGLDAKTVKQLVYQTALGSIDLLIKNKKSAKELRKSIAIKGGTTEAAINVFQEKNQLKKIIGRALNAAVTRSKELGKK